MSALDAKLRALPADLAAMLGGDWHWRAGEACRHWEYGGLQWYCKVCPRGGGVHVSLSVTAERSERPCSWHRVFDAVGELADVMHEVGRHERSVALGYRLGRPDTT